MPVGGEILFLVSWNQSYLLDLIKTKGSKYKKFFWQDGYGGFSVSSSKVETIKRYILSQKEHHKKMSFIEEYKLFLDEYGIEYDDKYI